MPRVEIQVQLAIFAAIQAIFAAIFLLLMHTIKWIDLRMY